MLLLDVDVDILDLDLDLVRSSYNNLAIESRSRSRCI